MAKKLEKPGSLDTMEKTGITVKKDNDDEVARKREMARKMVRRRPGQNMAKQQAMAENCGGFGTVIGWYRGIQRSCTGIYQINGSRSC